MEINENLERAAEILLKSKHTTAFTGAGISVESGIPPFRGDDGLWAKYDPIILDLDYFMKNPEDSWKVIKELFYDFFDRAMPNKAHLILAQMEKQGMLQEIITQNIDSLHQKAGSQNVYEFHGTSARLICTSCNQYINADKKILKKIPPYCTCGGLLKPDFVFFSEAIPAIAYEASSKAAKNAEAFLIIGTTGEIIPASYIPLEAKQNGAKIIEINTEASQFTKGGITDVFLKGKATTIMARLAQLLNIQS